MGKIETLIPIILFNLFLILFIVGIIIFIRQYKIKKREHDTTLQIQHQEHQRELLTTQIEIQNQTMQHIGREIHDNIGQKLTLASLYTQQLAFENKAPHINENIENISTIINESLSELRALSKSLTDNTIEENSMDTLIIRECSKIMELKKCDIKYTNNDKNLDLNYQTKAIFIRIIQEFIQNSIKHSNCKLIEVNLNSNSNTIELQLKDDGIGFDFIASKQKNSGIGLTNMQKRTEILGGNFNFESTINLGTTLTITLPV